MVQGLWFTYCHAPLDSFTTEQFKFCFVFLFPCEFFCFCLSHLWQFWRGSYFGRMSKNWICLLFLMIRIRWFIFGKIITEVVLCPFQCILSGGTYLVLILFMTNLITGLRWCLPAVSISAFVIYKHFLGRYFQTVSCSSSNFYC